MRTFVLRAINTALLTLAVVLAGSTSAPARASSTVTATEAVNVRTSPTTTAKVIGSLSRGQKVTAIKSAGSGWTQIRYSGAKAAYVKTTYLSATARSSGTSASRVSTTRATALPKVSGTRVATAKLSLRATSDPRGKVLVKLAKGTSVAVTGATKGDRAQIVYRGAVRWVNGAKLANPKVTQPPALPRIIGTKVATAKLSVRATTNPKGKVLVKLAKGTSVSITGATNGDRAQIVYRGAARWVNRTKLADPDVGGPVSPRLPKITGVRYATAVLDIRSNNTDTYTLIAEVPKGTPLSITGVEANGRAQIVFSSAVRWVTAKYLSSTPPTAGGGNGGGTPNPKVEKGLKPNAVKTYRAVIKRFPEITSVGGVRPDSLPDHPSGRALDLMIPNYKSSSGKRMGGEVAAWLKLNAEDLGINYVIWDQHIWNITRDKEGWRYMASRGSDSANHKNHVHVTVFADGYRPR